MTLLQIIVDVPKWYGKLGFVNFSPARNGHVITTKEGSYGYHPYDEANTNQNYGNFKLELIK